MKSSLQTLSFIPEDVRNLMREEEIKQAWTLAESRYYEFALKEKSVNEGLQAILNQQFQQHAKNEPPKRDNFNANAYWDWRADYDKRLSPQTPLETKESKVLTVGDKVVR